MSVNPVDTKIRSRRSATGDTPEVIGWDAVGEVVSCGASVSGFAAGDRVYYAGALERPGSNAEYQLVDARIAAHAPLSLSAAEAAALPLTAITAWELLFDRLGVSEGGGEGQTLLVVGAAGGVGSILVQLARQLTKLTVVGTCPSFSRATGCQASPIRASSCGKYLGSLNMLTAPLTNNVAERIACG